MNIDRIQVTIQELIDGYEEKGPDGIEGVVAYGGRLDVRPAYQREYIYPDKDRDEVIRSVKKKFPINVMYWAKTADGRYELMDGQQRTISICRYAAVKDEADRQSYEQCFSVDNLYFFNLPEDQKQEYRALWEEFEKRETPEAKFANTLDKVQPVLLNHASGGKSWREHGIKKEQILNRNRTTHEGSETLWDYIRTLIEENTGKGNIIE